MGGGGGAESGFFYSLKQKSSHCVLIEVQKGDSVLVRLHEMVVGSSFIPSVALLVHPSVTAHSIVNCHEFTRSQT